jgi:amino acid adenylation domain-containing protein
MAQKPYSSGETGAATHSNSKDIKQPPYYLNKTARDYPQDKCVHELFEEQVQKTPDAVAVIYEDQVLTYRQLNERANQLAHYLRKQGVGPNNLVGICMNRSLELEVALIGTLKAGGAYVPLDISYPTERLSFIIDDTGLDIVLTQYGYRCEFANGKIKVIPINGECTYLEGLPTINPKSIVNLKNLVYIIYTSGSTGKPKGVMVEHGALLNQLQWFEEQFHLNETDVVLQKTPVSFDVSTWEFFWPLMYGAQIVFSPPRVHKDPYRLIKLIREHRVTIINFVPSMLGLFLQHPDVGQCTSLKSVICAGENLPSSLQEDFFGKLNASLYNLYGPTETIAVSFWECKRDHNANVVPIGHPIANTQLYILDSHNNPVPPGISGELYVGGVQLAQGYLNRPELTRERFIPNPFDPTGQTRLYKTGDLCRYLPDGNIEFIGRLDHQVKIRGFRIELGEIENTLTLHPDVRQAVVLAREDRPGDKRLVAYLLCSQQLSVEQLHDHLSQTLPDYMIPSAFVFLDAMPLTPNGKVNRQALPAPEQDSQAFKARYTPRESIVHKALAEIFADVLGVEKVSIHDDFFELGGHSLLAVKLLDRIQKQFGRSFPLATLFHATTVKKLADLLAKKQPDTAYRSIVQIRSGGKKEPIFLLPGIGGHSMAFAELADHLDPERPVFGLELRGLDGKTKPHETIEDMASYFIDLVRGIQKRGPYHLGGYSLGAHIAFEMALQFADKGDTVGMLALIAGVAPGQIRLTRWRVLNYTFRMFDLLSLPTSEKLRYLPFKMNDVRRKIKRWREKRNLSKQEQLSGSTLSTHIKQVERAARKAITLYKPSSKYDGNILLFRDTHIDSPLYRNIIRYKAGWEHYVTGAIECHGIPSGHIDILSGNHVVSLAGKINNYLQRAECDMRPRHSAYDAKDRLNIKELAAFNSWPIANNRLVLPRNELHIFLADLSVSAAQISKYEMLLSPDELDRATRYARTKDRNHFVARRGLLRELISRYTGTNPANLRFKYSKDGKPSLRDEQNLADLRFSVSNSNGLALYGFICASDLGIDLEYIRHAEDLLDIASKKFNSEEYRSLMELPENLRTEAFYTCWTCKEAYIKARGIIGLDQFTVSVQPSLAPRLVADQADPSQVTLWSFSLVDVDNHWRAAVVTQVSDVPIRCWRLSQTP